MANKFLIVGNKFYYSSSVDYHRELMPKDAKTVDVQGGGWFFLDRATKTMFLFDKSEEFGYASAEDIVAALERTLFPSYMNGVKFSISYCDKLSDAMENPTIDWVYDDSKDLVVDDVAGKPDIVLEGNFQTFDVKTAKNYPIYIEKNLKRVEQTNQPIRVTKIGRNELCSCGSGKKFKRCCIK